MTVTTNRRRVLLGAGSLALTGLPALGRAQAAWTSYTYTPAATLAPARGVARMAEALQKDGVIALRQHLGGALPINAQNITGAVGDNVIQFGDDGFFHGNIPIGGVMRLPMLITTADEMARASKAVLPYLDAAYAKKGIVLLGYYHYPIQSAWSRRKLASLADLNGSKMRVTSPEQGEFVRRFGGVPVTVSASEVPSALERGVVDGVFTAASGGGKIWKDLLKSQYGVGPNFFDAVLIANKDAFGKLPTAGQAKLKQAAADAAQWITAETAREESEVSAKLVSEGMVMTPVSTADAQEGRKRLAPYWDEWAKGKGAEAVEVLAKVRAAIGS
jgi:TRAP-type C4-dicarboxylate transport system substrate-binding protein